jgi:Cd2+/Zn2+-exporting ATPase/Cu+-exporting ATPase
VIKQNIAASIVFNITGIALASMGFLSPTMAAVAHALPDFVLFLNSSRLIRE